MCFVIYILCQHCTTNTACRNPYVLCHQHTLSALNDKHGVKKPVCALSPTYSVSIVRQTRRVETCMCFFTNIPCQHCMTNTACRNLLCFVTNILCQHCTTNTACRNMYVLFHQHTLSALYDKRRVEICICFVTNILCQHCTTNTACRNLYLLFHQHTLSALYKNTVCRNLYVLCDQHTLSVLYDKHGVYKLVFAFSPAYSVSIV